MIHPHSGRSVTGEIEAKQALSRSSLSDYVVNPYLGCQHGCRYCYVQRYFRPRTSPPIPWGLEVYARTNMSDLVCREAGKKASGKVLLSSMTDAYQPLESHYRLTRGVLECLVETDFPISILTKSSLVLRDLDLLTKHRESEVTFSISSLDREVYGAFEPAATPPEARINALRSILESGVKGGLFVAPHIPVAEPFDVQYRPILESASELGLHELLFDFLNFSSVMKRAILKTYESDYPQGMDTFLEMTRNPRRYEENWKTNITELAKRVEIKASFV